MRFIYKMLLTICASKLLQALEYQENENNMKKFKMIKPEGESNFFKIK